MIKGLISVIIPCKDRDSIEPFCLRSLEDQIFKNFEIIIKEGTQVCVNRNNGAREAQGEYLFFCDNDIDLKDDCLYRMYDALEKNPDCDFAYCRFYKTGEITGLQESRPWDFEALKKQNFVSTMSLIRASKFPGFREDLERFHDWDLYLRIAENGSKGYYIPDPLFTAVYKSGGISTNKENYTRCQQRIKNLHNIK